jgi:hypothetical protein
MGARSRTAQPILQPINRYALLYHVLWLVLILELLGLSESQIRRQLTLEEEKEDITDTTIDSGDEFTETKFMLHGLDLEGQQYVNPAVFSGS